MIPSGWKRMMRGIVGIMTGMLGWVLLLLHVKIPRRWPEGILRPI